VAAPLAASCNAIASSGQAANCQAVEGLFCTDAGPGGTLDAGGGGCSALAACCASMAPGDPRKTACTLIEGNGNDAQCDQIAQVYCP
jgi:hypothetical protein